jgi:hypothetical protein
MLAIGAPSGGGGFGLTVGGEISVLPIVSLRIGGAFRQGLPLQVDSGSFGRFDSTTWIAGGGISLRPLRSNRARRFGISVRVDGLAELQILSNTGGTQSNWLPALDAIGDLSFLFLDDVECVLGGGVEYTPRSHSFRLSDGETASRDDLHVRGVGEAGIRIRF